MTDLELPPVHPVEDAFEEDMHPSPVPDGFRPDMIAELLHPDPAINAKAKRIPTQAEEI